VVVRGGFLAIRLGAVVRKKLAGEGVDEGTLQALIYMGADESAFPGKREPRAQVWRVKRVGDAVPDNAQIPARVCRVLQVDGAGDRGLTQVAGAQRGLVHLSQLRELGISRGSYSHRVAVGALHRVLPSVLSVVHPLIEPWAPETAVLLYAGADAVLSHESAAALWGLTSSPSFVAITMVGRKVESQPQLKQHRVSALDIRDVSLRHGLPVTSPARTLIDCATNPNLDRLLNEARALKLVKDAEIHQAIERCPGRKGTAALRALLAAEKDSGFTQSKAERRLKRLIGASGLERPMFNTHLEGVRVDAYWPRLKVVIEVDGYQFHGNWAAFQRDRARDNKLVGAGYVVLRFTWHQLTNKPLQVVAEIARMLGRREAEMG
jgi:very-short-patch-repair endonuclease